ncbi:hypothetical protein K1719_025584 [Acacia pycnantha]|nr:hypothetical protein K1719_025584 [Acacia pycnantha]
MWPSLISKAKEGGIDVIQTYVFWNQHEHLEGQYDFSGRRDIVRFIKEIQSQGLYVTLRIGPFIQSEWTYGGLPIWLHDVPGIVFRSDNEPFKYHMKKFTTHIVNSMKSHNLFASQGGPIILSQIENEYGMIEAAYGEGGPRYVRWAAQMAVGLQTGVPWVMCKQDDAPDPVINACNGMECGRTFKGPNSPDKPSIWTENWTSFYQAFGDEPYLRSAENIAYSVALFIAKKGSYVNYYMYHGGTNFGRTAAAFMVTAYYDEAPLDEYGLIRQPKWGHLRDLHAAIKSCSKTLLSATPTTLSLGGQQQAYVFRKSKTECAAFLENRDQKEVTVRFQSMAYKLPPQSISILPDCKSVAFNTAQVRAKHSTRTMNPVVHFQSAQQWKVYNEAIPNFGRTISRANGLVDQIIKAKDKSDYMWYTLRFSQSSSQSLLSATSHGHVLHAFGATVGLPDSGAYLEHKVAGLRNVRVGDTDFSQHSWGYQVGLVGEYLQVYTETGSSKVQWKKLGSSNPLTWYKMWPSLISKAKEGGIDVIQTYVFWNQHEHLEGQYDFNGRRDIVRFIKEIQSQGLYVTLRIGPFIQSEWTYGGLPIWLHDVPGIVFRSDNEPFKYHMKKFTTHIVNSMKSHNLFASQGGPIILSQIENEYGMIEAAFGEGGPSYVRWAAQMAVGLQTGVPWVMCKQDDAPDPVINACNGKECGRTFKGPNSPDKPSIWTENWTSFYQAFGDEPHLRSAENIAYGVALFIAKKGSYVNYYMYHGGTNFGRTAAAFMVTAYYDEAPLDEYGLIRQPKWGHLRDLHAAIKSCSKTLLSATPTTLSLGGQQEAYVFRKSKTECAAFLENRDHKEVTVRFQSMAYKLPPQSISILPDCKSVAFNTAQVRAKHSTRTMNPVVHFQSAQQWKVYNEAIPNFSRTISRANGLVDQISQAKDKSDYMWYTLRFSQSSSQSLLSATSHGHVLHAFVNGDLQGSAHGSHDNISFTLKSNIKLKEGVNHISFLSATVGLPILL